MHDDINIKGLVAFLGILAGTVVSVYLVLTLMLHGFERRARKDDQAILHQASAAAPGQPYFPLPREQADPVADLHALRAREQAEINSYGWVNRTSGIVRIPIARAMDLLSQPSGRRP